MPNHRCTHRAPLASDGDRRECRPLKHQVQVGSDVFVRCRQRRGVSLYKLRISDIREYLYYRYTRSPRRPSQRTAESVQVEETRPTAHGFE